MNFEFSQCEDERSGARGLSYQFLHQNRTAEGSTLLSWAGWWLKTEVCRVLQLLPDLCSLTFWCGLLLTITWEFSCWFLLEPTGPDEMGHLHRRSFGDSEQRGRLEVALSTVRTERGKDFMASACSLTRHETTYCPPTEILQNQTRCGPCSGTPHASNLQFCWSSPQLRGSAAA